MALPSGDRLASIGSCLAIQAAILLLGSWLVSWPIGLRQPPGGDQGQPPALKR